MSLKETILPLADAYAAAGFTEGKANTHLFPFEVGNKVDVREKARAALIAALDAADAENEKLRLDAERYRFCFTSDDFAVCDYEGSAPFCEGPGGWRWMDKDEADNRIDAARAALGEKT